MVEDSALESCLSGGVLQVLRPVCQKKASSCLRKRLAAGGFSAALRQQQHKVQQVSPGAGSGQEAVLHSCAGALSQPSGLLCLRKEGSPALLPST